MPGKQFLRELSKLAFDDASDTVPRFVSEYELPVQPGWQTDIPFTYRCPDFACGDASRVLIVIDEMARAGGAIAHELRLAS